MKILPTIGRILAILAAALLVTWGLYRFVNSDFAAILPANRRELELAESGFSENTAISEHDEDDYEAREAAAFAPPGRGAGGEHRVGDALDVSEAGEMIEPLVKVAVAVGLFAVGGRLFGRRRTKRTATNSTAGA